MCNDCDISTVTWNAFLVAKINSERIKNQIESNQRPTPIWSTHDQYACFLHIVDYFNFFEPLFPFGTLELKTMECFLGRFWMRPDLFVRLLVDEPVPLSMSMPFQSQHFSLYGKIYSMKRKNGRHDLRSIQAFWFPWIYPARLYTKYISTDNTIYTCNVEKLTYLSS